MFGTVIYLEGIGLFKDYNYNKFDFWLLTLSTVMIAAAGNIINDYFDVKADRINRPEKLIITKHIKRRWAIVSHWLLNSIAFVIGIYLSVKYETFSFAFIQLVSINLLWFYSMFFKRKVLIGNLIVAFLTSLIPILALIFMYFSPGQHNQLVDPSAIGGILDADFSIIHLLAFFAFTQNFAREIIKDAEDIEGDRLIFVQSLPMLIGIKGSLYVSGVILMLLPIFMLMIGLNSPLNLNVLHNTSDLWLFQIAAAINILSILLIIFVPRRLKLIDILIKISMLAGISALFQLSYL
jgi:4-hydroxybenzoate polyprenyltransferase